MNMHVMVSKMMSFLRETDDIFNATLPRGALTHIAVSEHGDLNSAGGGEKGMMYGGMNE